MFPINDLKQARAYALALPRGAAVPDVDNAKFRLTSSMVAYVLDFQSAKQKQSLHQFDVQRRLEPLRRLPGEMFAILRSVAGLLILCGLLCTLATLSKAVGPLGDAFRDLSSKQEVSAHQARPPSGQPGSATDKVNRIQNTMGTVAKAAQLAFGYSFFFILAAALLTLTIASMQRYAFSTIARFSTWAEHAYRNDLPEQISIGEAAVAFKENAQALGDLTRSFSDLSLSLAAVKNFATTMEDVREAIVKALDRMPGEIQASMGLVTKDMVKNLERAMKDEVEAIKKILAIYGAQEFRIDEIRKHVEAVRELTEKTTAAAITLEAVPKQLNAIDSSLRQHTAVAGRIEVTAKKIEEAVLAFPSDELKTSAKALIDATKNIGQAHTQAVEAISELQSKAAVISILDSEVGKKLDTITTVSQQFLGAYDNLMSNSNAGQKLIAEGLERVATQIEREITKLADKAEIVGIRTQLKKLELAFEDFRNRLRLVRTAATNPPPVPTATSTPAAFGAQGSEANNAVANDSAGGQDPSPQVGPHASSQPDHTWRQNTLSPSHENIVSGKSPEVNVNGESSTPFPIPDLGAASASGSEGEA